MNNDLNPKWSRQTNVDNEFKENVPTAITSDLAGNIYVTGYMYNPLAGVYGSAGYDFATVKYSGETEIIYGIQTLCLLTIMTLQVPESMIRQLQ
ncbi:MAG: hypothetical protein R2942_18830 [Ignavibacteria bacterium]